VSVRRSQRYRSSEDESKRTILAHVEHLRSIGEALTRAADTYMAGHNASQAESEHGWREDLAINIGDAIDEFHRSLAEVPRRTLDRYLAEDEDEDEDKDETPAGAAPGERTTRRANRRSEPTADTTTTETP
jgi:hypothetical protein